MEVTALFCDQASISDTGKLDIQGVFNELQAPGFPARQDRLVLAGVVHWDRDDEGQLPFRVDLTHPDGHAVYSVDGHADVKPRPEPEPPPKSYLVLNLEKVMFTAPGQYRVRASIKGREFAGPSLFLTRAVSGKEQDTGTTANVDIRS